jgi:hypothetical protein
MDSDRLTSVTYPYLGASGQAFAQSIVTTRFEMDDETDLALAKRHRWHVRGYLYRHDINRLPKVADWRDN